METIKEFEAAEAILHGHFILSSGLHSETYLQCAKVLMDPKRAERLCKELANKIIAQLPEITFDMVVSPAMGGILVGYEVARQLNLPSVFCERENGIFTLRRGFSFPQNARILVVEDVLTTGKSSRETFVCIEKFGGKVVAEACLVDRSNGQADLGVPLISLLQLNVKTFDKDNVPEHLQKIPAVKPGSRHLLAL